VTAGAGRLEAAPSRRRRPVAPYPLSRPSRGPLPGPTTRRPETT